MIVFKTFDGEIEKIEGNTFKRLTKEKAPYYQVGADGKMKYYAICPECNNTINIIHLFNDNTLIEEDRRPVKTHGKHSTSNIKGFSDFNKDAYDKCSLSNPKRNQGKGKEVLYKRENEIKMIVETYSENLRKAIQKIIGVNISQNIFEKMKANFMSQEGHLYRFINRYNLPYTFLYLSRNTYLVSQYLKPEHINAKKISIAIEEKSLFYKVEKYQIVKKNSEKSKLEMRFEEHTLINQNDFESMEMLIEENEREIFREKILVNDFSFIKELDKK